jgi:peptidyl-prolyl cis-trans isomerase SurA
MRAAQPVSARSRCPGTGFAVQALLLRSMPLLLMLLVGAVQTAKAQYPKLVDKVVAQVGDRMVLKSDIEFQVLQLSEEQTPTPEVRCTLLDQQIAQQLLVLQAEEDSVVVSEDEVELELNRRFDYFIGLLGSPDKLEEFYGKSIAALKDDFREDISNQLLAQRMQQQIAGDVRISPAEVRQFYREIPEDSLPYFDAEVKLSQLVLIPEPTAEQRAFARETASDLRDRVLNGEKLGFLASIYSDDPGSKEQDGDLGCVGRGQFVPEFEAAAFRLKDGEVSDVVETQFGFHVIEMVERRGEQACLRHILIQPQVTSSNLAQASGRLDSIAREIREGRLSFAEAVAKFSMDEASQRAGGEMINPNTGAPSFEIDELEREVYYAIEQLEPGELSSPQPFYTPTGSQAYRLLLLRDQTEPHQANLDQDYSKIQAAALQQKRARIMEDWLTQRLGRTYLRVDAVFGDCTEAERWRTAAAASGAP